MLTKNNFITNKKKTYATKEDKDEHSLANDND
jgi:hypothetical protein